jgi:acetolactate decarboxylase
MVKGRMKSPFAMTTFFKPDIKFSVTRNPDYWSSQEFIDSRLPTKNIPYAIKIEGNFSYIKARSVPAQNKPYPLLAEVVNRQSIFEFRDIEGTLVGFRMPDYAQGINMPGYHLHFLSRDKTKGGHVLECAVENAEASIDSTSRLTIALPESPDFYRLDFSGKPAATSSTEAGN